MADVTTGVCLKSLAPPACGLIDHSSCLGLCGGLVLPLLSQCVAFLQSLLGCAVQDPHRMSLHPLLCVLVGVCSQAACCFCVALPTTTVPPPVPGWRCRGPIFCCRHDYTNFPMPAVQWPGVDALPMSNTTASTAHSCSCLAQLELSLSASARVDPCVFCPVISSFLMRGVAALAALRGTVHTCASRCWQVCCCRGCVCLVAHQGLWIGGGKHGPIVQLLRCRGRGGPRTTLVPLARCVLLSWQVCVVVFCFQHRQPGGHGAHGHTVGFRAWRELLVLFVRGLTLCMFQAQQQLHQAPGPTRRVCKACGWPVLFLCML